MVEIESEVMLLGHWKNFEELEEHLTLEELKAIKEAGREKEYRHFRFLAGLKGIDLDEGRNSEAKQKFEEIKARANAKLAGMSEEEYTLTSDDFGFDFEVE